MLNPKRSHHRRIPVVLGKSGGGDTTPRFLFVNKDASQLVKGAYTELKILPGMAALGRFSHSGHWSTIEHSGVLQSEACGVAPAADGAFRAGLLDIIA